MNREDELLQEDHALRERLSRLSEAILGINDNLDFDTALQEVLDSARALTQARCSVRWGLKKRPPPPATRLCPPKGRDPSFGGIGPILLRGEVVGANGRSEEGGNEGEIVLCGENLGYYPAAAPPESFPTGDLGILEPSGELFVTGRNAAFLKNRGFRVSPERIESLLMTTSGIRDGQVLMRDNRIPAEVVADGDAGPPSSSHLLLRGAPAGLLRPRRDQLRPADSPDRRRQDSEGPTPPAAIWRPVTSARSPCQRRLWITSLVSMFSRNWTPNSSSIAGNRFRPDMESRPIFWSRASLVASSASLISSTLATVKALRRLATGSMCVCPPFGSGLTECPPSRSAASRWCPTTT